MARSRSRELFIDVTEVSQLKHHPAYSVVNCTLTMPPKFSVKAF
jgi:hypothetical protein